MQPITTLKLKVLYKDSNIMAIIKGSNIMAIKGSKGSICSIHSTIWFANLQLIKYKACTIQLLLFC